jgi:hypothetical protein
MNEHRSGQSSSTNLSTPLPADRYVIPDDNDLDFQSIFSPSLLSSEMKVKYVSSVIFDDQYCSGFSSNSSNGVDDLGDIW